MTDEFFEKALAELPTEIERLGVKTKLDLFDEYRCLTEQQRFVQELVKRMALDGKPLIITIPLSKPDPLYCVGMLLPTGATGFDGESSDGLGVGTRQS